ncbi:transcription termination factor Rho [Corynebacterium sp.]|uniref:transcription termination factor Rho n=1 Tax=Corynebacterium sp. TaxID=1720 RepID=UPI0026DCCB27|nr:transcription termination factor Rho [Corynebacterium sp.]MDO4610140.1 transcription termination factor Rho [Corynebacterium sp.]
MSDTDTTAQDKGQDNLAALRMPELKAIAAQKGIRGVSAMRKSDLIAAIQGHGGAAKKAAGQERAAEKKEKKAVDEADRAPKGNSAEKGSGGNGSGAKADAPAGDRDGGDDRDRGDRGNGGQGNGGEDRPQSRSQARRARRNRNRNRGNDDQGSRNDNGGRNDGAGDKGNGGQNNNGGRNNHHDDDDEQGGRRGRRNRRNRRDRKGRDNKGGGGPDEIREGDVLQPVAGIVDVLDNNSAFVRTSGYLPGPNDVFVSQQMVKKHGLRRGDAVVGQVRMPRDGGTGGQVTHGSGRNKRKYNPLVLVDKVNGMSAEEATRRRDFAKLTPLYPNRRLRLETEQKILTTRVIDLIMPIGKGQRALIVSPPKAGKTTILQNIANAIATNNPECYMMVVLVDERPEEVTDMQRSVRGEVIASTFDRPPSDHTAVAELAIERAKRLVEQGEDVVVLLDSITRLGRAYNNCSPASGRILSGGVDSNALYPPKRFLGAARNIEEGGSLTIIATAMVETGSAGDTVIFEEFKGTGNAELKLDRRISERRVFPAVDVNPSGTRKDDLLLSAEEARIMHKLRRILSALEPQAAIDLLIKQLKKTKNNREFLAQVASSAPMAADVDVDEMV